MFHFDTALLPQLTTRKALIIVDFQVDFIDAADGGLPVKEPEGFVGRAIDLANAFRTKGDVVWVQSHFDKIRPVDGDQIIVSDDAPAIHSSSSRKRSKRIEPVLEPPSGPPDPEAFLSQEEPTCVKPPGQGCEMPSNVKEAVKRGDLMLKKSHYSAFLESHLLRMLRGKMVMEVFICGSLTNVGVYATALDAAGHGLTITVVEDCCGYRHESRQRSAIKSLVELTGCEIASFQEVMDNIVPDRPRPAALNGPPQPSPPCPPVTSVNNEGNISRASMTPEIVGPMTSLRLASVSPESANVQGEATQSAQPSKNDLNGESWDESQKGPADETLNTFPEKTQDEPKKELRGEGQDETPSVMKVDAGAEGGSSLLSPFGSAAIEKEAGVESMGTIAEGHPDSKTDMDPSQSNQPPSPSAELPSNQASSPPPSLPDSSRTQKQFPNDNAESENEDEPILQKGLCEGDVDVVLDVLPDSIAQTAFEELQKEVHWQRMSHQGGEVPRLVAVQGEVASDGSMPVYRHPADESPPLLPFSPTVLAIRSATEKHLGHPLNHALIQFYRDGNDYISEHSDKTLDIVAGSYIANVSLGAERTMVLRTKRQDKDPSRTEPLPSDTKRQIQRARLPHNSMFRMGLQTNMKWMHAIRQDKRADRDKSPAELAYSGGRISLTFRHIGTFLSCGETMIWGQGATGKTRVDAHPVFNGHGDAAVRMLQGFGAENHSSNFDWKAHYGQGFDVLHITSSPRFFASADASINMRIHLQLAEYGISFAKGSMVAATRSGDDACQDIPIKFVDNDACHSVVDGDIAIMLYLESRYGRHSQTSPNASDGNQAEIAKGFTRFQKGLRLLKTWRRIRKEKESDGRDFHKSLRKELAVWDGYAAETSGGARHPFIAGEFISLADFAVWPVLHAMWEDAGSEAFEGVPGLQEYYQRVLMLESAKKVLAKSGKVEVGANT